MIEAPGFRVWRSTSRRERPQICFGIQVGNEKAKASIRPRLSFCVPNRSAAVASEAVSYLRLIDCVHHSPLGLRVIKGERERGGCGEVPFVIELTAHRLCVSLNSRLERKKQGERERGGCGGVPCVMRARFRKVSRTWEGGRQFNLRTTTSQKRAVVPRRARIQGS